MMVVDQEKNAPYKKTIEGMVPEDWSVKRLEQICSHFKSGYGITSDSIAEEAIYPVYGGNGLRGYTNTKTHSGSFILIGRQGALCGNIQRIKGESYISEHAIAVQTNENNSLDFLGYKLEFKKLNRYSESSAQPGLSVAKLLRLKIALPSLPEQCKIAEILSTWDEAIAQTKALIEQLKLRNKGLAQQLLTGKKRLKGFSGEWKEVKLGSLINESRVPSKKPDPSRRISVKLNLKGVEKREERGTEAIDSTAYFTRYAGQFIYGKQNLHKGALGIIPDELNGFESTQDIPTFDFSDLVSPNWFLAFMSREDFYTRLESIATGTGSKRIHPNNLFKIAISIPPIEEQEGIVGILEVGIQELNGYESHLEFLQEQKKGLIQKLLTGEVRVKIE